jgi:hypothetical protein
MAAPTLQIAGARRMQPGWVRVYLKAADAPNGAQYKASLVCAAPTDVKSVSISQTTGRVLGIDIVVNAAWLQDNSLPRPCRISHLTVSMQANGVVYADASQDADIPMDLPLSLLTPGNTTMDAAQASVPLAAAPAYAAYPPLIVAIKSSTGLVGFAEVEELPERGTAGLRGLSVFKKGKLNHELGGGAEIPPGWGLDIDTLGIWRAPQLDVETTHSGHDVFPYSGSVWPPLLAPNAASLNVFPFTPAHSEADYKKYVLDNRGVHRCQSSTGCMDLTYNAADHALDAANGATLTSLAPGAIVLGAQTNRSRRLASAGLDPVSLPAPAPLPQVRPVVAYQAPAAAILANIDPKVSKRLMATANALSRGRTGDFGALQKMPTSLFSSSALTESSESTRNFDAVKESEEEQSPAAAPGGGAGSMAPNSSNASCVIDSAGTGVTRTPSACNGMSATGFSCPTKDSPITVEGITATTDQAAFLGGTIPPYYAGRDNHFGTCATISQIQYVEALYDRYTDDLAIKRVIYVDGDPIVVPEPRVALTPAGFRILQKTWDGTHTGAALPSGKKAPNPPTGESAPNIPEAYWPAREGDWKRWASTGGQEATPKCGPSYWTTPFCMGQGTPPQGVYKTHTEMVANLNRNPLSDPPYSLANSYMNTVPTTLPLTDRDAAIQAVMEQIRVGLPVKLNFKSAPGKGHFLSYKAGPTWYLPPELGACSKQTLNAAFHPSSGHDVLIVGYWISGAPASPDLFNSYFIIENNWGKTSGYHSFFFMNFAAFKYLAGNLKIFRLDRTCWSVACAAQPPVALPAPLLKQLLYPPDPQSPAAQTYAKALDDARAQLGGVAGGGAKETEKPAPPKAKHKHAQR